MTDTDLGEFEEAPPLSPEQLFSEARFAAKSPKPTIADMIETVFRISGELEEGQFMLLLWGDRLKPYAPKMRDAAVLTALGEFLCLVQTKQDAVADVLRGRK